MTVSEPKTGNKLCLVSAPTMVKQKLTGGVAGVFLIFFWALILTDRAMAESQTEFATVTTKNPLLLIIGRVLRRWRMEIEIARKPTHVIKCVRFNRE